MLAATESKEVKELHTWGLPQWLRSLAQNISAIQPCGLPQWLRSEMSSIACTNITGRGSIALQAGQEEAKVKEQDEMDN